MIDHAYIEKHSLIERYHQGQLSPEEEERFEAYFTDCPQCMEQLEMARELQLGLRAMVAEDAVRTAQVGLLAWFRQSRLSLQLGMVLAALLVFASLPMAGYFAARSSQGRALAETRADADDWERRFRREQQSTAELERQLAASERHRSDEQSRLEARLAEFEAAARGGTSLLQQPLINTPVFLLATVRSGEPAATIDLGSIGDYLVLAVDVGDDHRMTSYRITITDAGGARLWRQDGLLPNALEAVMMTFPSSFFAPGDYRLAVEGLLPDGRTVELQSYRYRVVGMRSSSLAPL